MSYAWFCSFFQLIVTDNLSRSIAWPIDDFYTIIDLRAAQPSNFINHSSNCEKCVSFDFSICPDHCRLHLGHRHWHCRQWFTTNNSRRIANTTRMTAPMTTIETVTITRPLKVSLRKKCAPTGALEPLQYSWEEETFQIQRHALWVRVCVCVERATVVACLGQWYGKYMVLMISWLCLGFVSVPLLRACAYERACVCIGICTAWTMHE